jgi:hypothetical protein
LAEYAIDQAQAMVIDTALHSKAAQRLDPAVWAALPFRKSP